MKNEILEQSLQLSEEILSNIELNEISLANITLKVSRLARLLDDFEFQKIFQYEYSGYPKGVNGLEKDIWSLLKKVNRTYFIKKEDDDGKIEEKEYARINSIEYYEHKLDSLKNEISSLKEINIILSSNANINSRNLNQNSIKLKAIKKEIEENSEILLNRKSFIYSYILEKYYELKYSKLNNDIFIRTQLKVDSVMMDILPDAIKKFTSVYSNLLSENNEDWSNAVHSCRRILQDLADEIYPPREPKKLPNGKEINLGTEQYINRLVAYIDEHSDSSRFQEIVGSNLKYIGERLDSIFNAAQKGSHKVISTQDEADRYVIYTYLIVGDILRLKIDVESKVENNK